MTEILKTEPATNSASTKQSLQNKKDFFGCVLLAVICIGAIFIQSLFSKHYDLGQREAVEETPIVRDSLTRSELFERENELVKKYGLDDRFGTSALYSLFAGAYETQYAELHERGLSMKIPYDMNYGGPYYELTPFDVVGDTVWYRTINACPAGCSGSRGFINGQIFFLPPGSSTQLVSDYEQDKNKDDGSCKEVAINEFTNGIYCYDYGSAVFAQPMLLIEGTNYTYEIHDAKCRLYEETKNEECRIMAESIRVE